MNHRRILLVDDNPAIHDDIRQLLAPADHAANDLDAAAAALFGGAVAAAPATAAAPDFHVDSAYQGQEAFAKVTAACAAGQPYALAFVDMRMPPGWDGLTTICKLWEVDPRLLVVICTAYSDRGWGEIQDTLTARDRWLVLKKPFDKIELLQLAHSLTEKWRLGQLSRERVASLESAVAARTAQLTQAIQVKNEFLANITHELLTPMNGILGPLALVADSPLDEEQTQLIAAAHESSQHLLQLLQQILAFNQAEAGTLSLAPEPCRPRELLSEVAAVYQARATHKGLALEINVTPSVPEALTAPAAVIRQILLVLLDNAVKFTPAGWVSLSLTGDATRLIFHVRDTGIGLSPEQLAWIAVPFAQVDGGRARRNTGIGLGLPLATRLAASLGGELTLAAQPGGGTNVSFSVLLTATS